MPAVNPPSTTLQTIMEKVRRITRKPSESQLTTQQLADYINTFIVYDFPDHIKLFDNKTTFTWYCNPYQDVYPTDMSVLPTTNPLFNFDNTYSDVQQPVYIAGFETHYSQSREEMFRLYPINSFIVNLPTKGDSVTTFFFGTLANVPILANNVTFASVDINNQGLSVHDIPFNPFDGLGLLYDTNTGASVGTINYVNGDYSFTFPVAPLANTNISAQTFPYKPSRPTSILYYDNQFTLRPVPDQPYAITMDVYKRPSAILNTTDLPLLNDYWQYIAYGAAKKVFEDTMDLDSVQLIMPEFEKQQELVLRRTLMILKNQSVVTIYNQQSSNSASPFYYGYGNY